MGERKRCHALVYKRDTYRLRRGYGFTMRYNKMQCQRAATDGDLCTQHGKQERDGMYVIRSKGAVDG